MMSADRQLCSASLAKDAVYNTGLRSFMEYRDLGIDRDCVLQPSGIVHNELECSDDVEILEIYSPAVHDTLKVEGMPEATAAH
jgi:hypothetical protein